MEDAKISNEEPLYQQGRFPSIIDTDDLVFELGKKAVHTLNYEKLLDQSIKRINTLTALSNESVVKIKELELKADSISQSNKTYEADNRKLGDELAKVRNELTQNTQTVNTLTAKYTQENNALLQKHNADLSMQDIRNIQEKESIRNEYQSKIDTLIQSHDVEIKQLQTTIETLTDSHSTEIEQLQIIISKLQSTKKKSTKKQ